jgi:hypothetical protein
MDFSNIKANLLKYREKLKLSNMKEGFLKKHDKRLRIYETMLDYMNASGVSGDLGYFSWYENQLDRRVNKSTVFQKLFYKITNTRNDQSFRNFLDYCIDKTSRGESMKSVMKDFMPDDEYNLFTSNTSSDQRPVIKALENVCKDKITTSKLIVSIFTSNLFLLAFSAVVHVIFYATLYDSFLDAEILYGETVPDRPLTLMEENFYRYKFIIDYWFIICAGVAGFTLGLRWAIKNWCKRGVDIREQFFDFLPPFSVNKITTQYQIVMMLYYNLSSGKKWLESLELIKRLSSPYAKHQIDKIIRRTPNSKPNEALNIFYMGEAGDYIDSRSAGKNFVEVLESSVITLQVKKMEMIEKITSVIKKFIVLPLVWGGIALSGVPVFVHILNLAKDAQSAT